MKKVYWIVGAIVIIGGGVAIYMYYKKKKEEEAKAAAAKLLGVGAINTVKTDLVNAVASTDVGQNLNLGGMARVAAPAGSFTFGQSPLNVKGEVGNPNHGYYKDKVWYWYPKYV